MTAQLGSGYSPATLERAAIGNCCSCCSSNNNDDSNASIALVVSISYYVNTIIVLIFIILDHDGIVGNLYHCLVW